MRANGVVAFAGVFALAAWLSAGRAAPPHPPAHGRLAPAPPSVADGDIARAIADDTPLPLLAAEGEPPPQTASRAPHLVEGPMEQILYGRGDARAPATVVAQALRLFGHKLDLTRELALGDRVRLVVRSDGAAPVLDYAELDGAAGAVRVYRVADFGEDADAFADDSGASLRRLLLRTPLARPRPTSGFGPRLHPLLGYTRLHAGVDFGAPVGTPVFAAGDGVVEAVRWAAGYGRLVRLRHDAGLETAYAHLSAWAPELTPGTAVRQGQVIGWTGASGLATGPHLHFEVIVDGRPIDPATAAPVVPALSAPRRLALSARRREVDDLAATTSPAIPARAVPARG